MTKKDLKLNWGAVFDTKTDLIFLSSGFWLLLVMLLGIGLLPSVKYVELLIFCGFFLGTPHTLAPFFLTLHPMYRRYFKKDLYRRTLVTLGLWFALILVGYTAAIYSRFFLNLSGIQIFTFIATIHVLWNYFHFARQHFGILNLYNIRHPEAKPVSIKIEDLFCFFAVGLSMLNVLYFSWPFYQKVLLHFGWNIFLPFNWVPQWMPTLLVTLFLFSLYLISYSRKSLLKTAYIVMILVQPILGFYYFKHFHFICFTLTHWLTEIFLIHYLYKKSQPHSVRSRIMPSYILFLLIIGPLSYILIEVRQGLNYTALHTLSVPKEIALGDFSPWVHLLYLVPYAWLTTMHFYLDRVVYSSSSYKDQNHLRRIWNGANNNV